MVRFVAASDESKPGTVLSGTVTYAGLLAPAASWETHFIPEWRARVLESGPGIATFHTVDLRNPKGIGLIRSQCETKIAAAWSVIRDAHYLELVSAEAEHDDFNAGLSGLEIAIPGRRRQAFRPEHFAFSHYLLNVMRVIVGNHPEASTVDFVVERGGSEQDAVLTDLFDSTKQRSLPDLGLSDVAARMGSIQFLGKDYVPLQGADLIAWYARRIAGNGNLLPAERAQFDESTHHVGIRHVLPKADLVESGKRFKAQGTTGPA